MVYRYQARTIVTEPAIEPLTLVEMRSYLRVTATGSPATSPEDNDIDDFILTARVTAESDLQRVLITQTWDIFYDCFPSSGTGIIPIPIPPLQSVTTLKYTDVDGTVQEIDSDDYRVDTDSQPARITPSDENTWPSTDDITGAVVIRIVAGYGATTASIPELYRTGMKMLVGHYFENRQDIIVGSQVNSVPAGYESLIGRKRMRQV